MYKDNRNKSIPNWYVTKNKFETKLKSFKSAKDYGEGFWEWVGIGDRLWKSKIKGERKSERNDKVLGEIKYALKK